MPVLPSPRAELGRMAGFAAVGATGFCVDALVFLWLAQGLHVPVLPARAAAFVPATLVTWALNRAFVFRTAGAAGRKRDEYARHLAVQGSGIAINFAVFWLAHRLGLGGRSLDLVPLALGSGVAMVSNYLGARQFVFRR